MHVLLGAVTQMTPLNMLDLSACSEGHFVFFSCCFLELLDKKKQMQYIPNETFW